MSRRLLILGLLCLGLALCAGLAVLIRQASSPEGDMSLRTFQPCAPPCWQNIEPGSLSSVTDVASILRGLPFVERQTIQAQGGNYVAWFYRTPPGSGSIWLDDQLRVRKIKARPGFGLTLDEVLTRFGPPEGVSTAPVLPPDAPNHYLVTWYRPTRGLVFRAVGPESIPGTDVVAAVTPELRVDYVIYLEPQSFEAAAYVIDPSQASSIISKTCAWQGWGVYDDCILR